MSTVNTLKAARNLLEKGWTQGTYARDKNGASVDYRDPEACSFCISGVLKKVARGSAGHGVAVYKALDRHIPDPNPSYPMWNDDPCRTKEQVLNLFDKAIATAKTEETT